CGEEDVDASTRRRLDRGPGAIDVALGRTRQATDDGAARDADLARDCMHRFPVSVRRGWITRLDDVDIQPDELSRDRQLLRGRHRKARRLLPVAERGVEDAHPTIISRRSAPLPASHFSIPPLLSHTVAAPG